MLQPFVNVHNILQGIVGWGTADRLMILGGDNDKLMTTGIMHKVADLSSVSVKYGGATERRLKHMPLRDVSNGHQCHLLTAQLDLHTVAGETGFTLKAAAIHS